MAKPDKTDKPDDVLTDKVGKTDNIIDVEIIEDTSLTEDSDPQEATSEEALDLKEPGSQDDSGVGAAEDEAEASSDAPSENTDETKDTETSDEENDETSEVEEIDEPSDTAEVEEVSESNPESEQTAAVEPALAVAEKPRSGFVPLVLGGVVAAGLGFGAATYMGSQGMLFGGGSDEAIAELTRKLDAQNELIAGVQSSQDQIADSAAKQTNAGQAAVTESNARMAALSERVEELGGKLQTLEGRLIETEKRPMSEGASSAVIEVYEREVEQLRALVSEQLAEAEQLKATSTRTAQETLAQAALTRVVSAVDSGVPYRGALTELASVSGVAIPAELSEHADNGVPTSMALADGFPEYARLALADARKQEKGAVGGGHFTLFLKTQLGARSTEPKEGDDGDAILSRAEAALREGRLSASLAELDALPESSQAIMADWRGLAETRLAALSAVDALAQTLNSN